MDRRTLSIQLYPGKDDKIALWYDGIEGNRQEALKAALLYYIDRDKPVAEVVSSDGGDVLPLRDILMQGFTELINEQRLTRQAIANIQITVAAGASVKTGELNQEEIKRRDTNLRKTQQW